MDLARRSFHNRQRETLFFSCYGKSKLTDIDCAKKDIEKGRHLKPKFVFLDLYIHSLERINAANHLFQYHTYHDKMPHIYQWQFVDLMGDIFRVMFEPVPALARIINNTMSSLGLRENEYTSIHVRSRYPTESVKIILIVKEEYH